MSQKSRHLFCRRTNDEFSCLDKVSLADFIDGISSVNPKKYQDSPNICRGCKMVGVNYLKDITANY